MSEKHIHDFEAGDWGVVVGVSKCKECGHVATSQDFPAQQKDQS